MAYKDLIRESYPQFIGLIDRSDGGDDEDVKLKELKKDIRAALDAIQNNMEAGNIGDGSVSTAKLADGSVTAAKIADGTVITADVSDGAVTTGKLADNAVTTVKITDANVTNAKIVSVAGSKVTGTVPLAAVQRAVIPYQAVGLAAPGAITATGVKVGDFILAVMGFVTASGIWVGLNTTHFEAVATVANQIQQANAGNLSANTYIFLVQPQS